MEVSVRNIEVSVRNIEDCNKQTIIMQNTKEANILLSSKFVKLYSTVF